METKAVEPAKSVEVSDQRSCLSRAAAAQEANDATARDQVRECVKSPDFTDLKGLLRSPFLRPHYALSQAELELVVDTIAHRGGDVGHDLGVAKKAGFDILGLPKPKAMSRIGDLVVVAGVLVPDADHRGRATLVESTWGGNTDEVIVTFGAFEDGKKVVLGQYEDTRNSNVAMPSGRVVDVKSDSTKGRRVFVVRVDGKSRPSHEDDWVAVSDVAGDQVNEPAEPPLVVHGVVVYSSACADRLREGPTN